MTSDQPAPAEAPEEPQQSEVPDVVSSKPQISADGKTGDQMEVCLAQQTLIQMPELELNKLLG